MTSPPESSTLFTPSSRSSLPSFFNSARMKGLRRAVGTDCQACTTCSCAPVPSHTSTAARAAKAASFEPSVAKSTFSGMRSLSSLASNSTLLLLPLQQLHSAPGEEVGSVTVGVLVASIKGRVLVS